MDRHSKIDDNRMLQIMRKDLTDVELFLKEVLSLAAAYGGDARNGA